MKKLFLVLASLAMFSTVNANSLETETRIYQIAGKPVIVHVNPNYTEVFKYADIECTILLQIETSYIGSDKVTVEYFNRENNNDICLK